MIKRLRNLEFRNELIALSVMIAVVPFFKPDVPGGIFALGTVSAANLLMHAIGIILIYRINKFINFAQLAIGSLGAIFYTGLMNGELLFRGIRLVCSPCVGTEPSTLMLTINFIFAIVVSMAAGIGISLISYHALIRRFVNAPKLLLTIASIFLAQFISSLIGRFSKYFLTEEQRESEQGDALATAAAPPPFDFSIDIDPIPFRSADILMFIFAAVAVLGVGIYLRRSTTGTAIRAAAESPERAEALGINVFAVTGRVWVISGALSTAAAILNGFYSGVGGADGIPIDLLMPILTVAVMARFVSLPIAAVGAVALSILRQGLLWSFGTTAYLDAALVFLVAGLMLLQKARLTRAEREGGVAWRGTRELRPIPPELKELGVVRKWVRNLSILLAAVLLSLPWVLSPSQTNIAGVVLIYYLVGLSLLMLTGWAGQVSLGAFAFAAVGAWIVAVTPLPFFLSLVLAAIAGAVVAILVGFPALKLRGLHLAVSTLALAVSVSAIFTGDRMLGKLLPDSLDRPHLFGMDLDDERTMFYFLFVFAIGLTFAVLGMRRSRTGRALIAARDNEAATQSFGISLVSARITAFALSGFVAAFAGGLFAIHQNGVNAASFSPSTSVSPIFTFSVIGGLGGVSGPALGFAAYGMLILINLEIVRFFFEGLGGLALLFVAPGGMTLVAQDVRDALLKRVAIRYRIVAPTLIEDVLTTTRRAPMMEKVRPSGGQVFVPTRYEPPRQWALKRFGQITEEELVAQRRTKVMTVASLREREDERKDDDG